MVINTRNVDICVTCVSDKPPKLPLREELVSLGVEVVLNARGVGAKAVKHETRKQVHHFRKQYYAQEQKKRFCFPLWKSNKARLEAEIERKRQERELRKRAKGLSYAAYSKRLMKVQGTDAGSAASWGTNSTGNSSTEEQRGPESEIPNRLHMDAAAANAFVDSDATWTERVQSATANNEQPATIAVPSAQNAVSGAVVAGAAAAALAGAAVYHLSSDKSAKEMSAEQTKSTDELEALKDVDQGASMGTEDEFLLTEASNAISPKSEVPRQQRKDPQVASAFVDTEATWAERVNDGTKKEGEPVIISIPSAQSALPGAVVAGAAGLTAAAALGAAHEDSSRANAFSRDLDFVDNEDMSIATRDSITVGTGVYSDSRASASTRDTRKGSLLAALSRRCIPGTDDLHALVTCEPPPPNVNHDPKGNEPLHIACAKEFPNRCSSPDLDILLIVEDLVRDILQRRDELNIITRCHPSSCAVQNKDGDLPVHLLVRRLVEWEAAWQEKTRSAKVEGWADATKFTHLQKLMSECVDTVLHPIGRNRLAYRSRGKLGTRILPLHAAAIYGVPYDTLQTLLATYPEAASVPCDLGVLKTFIRNQLLPLELLERPRSELLPTPDTIEINKDESKDCDIIDVNSGIKWSTSALHTSNHAEDLVRRSDLIFAFHPGILPFRRDGARVRRMELLIRSEAQKAKTKGKNSIDPAALSAWIWMCTFDDSMNEEDTYVESVRRIVNGIDLEAVQLLATVDTADGILLATAQPEYKEVIQARLDGHSNCNNNEGKTNPTLPESQEKQASQRSILKRGRSNQISQKLDDPLSKENLCRQVFNVREAEFPTSFIILPYRLSKRKDGSLVLDSKVSASVAVQFAECLTRLTAPWHVHHILEKKAIDHLGYQLPPEQVKRFNDSAWMSTNARKPLLKLFEGNGFLYFLDESTGAPRVAISSDTPEPSEIIVENPAEALERLLPLMLMGMVRMRGENSTVILVRSMIEGKHSPPQRWISLAQNIVRYLYSQKSREISVSISKELVALGDPLADFVSRATKRYAKRCPESEDGHEWLPELSYLKNIVKNAGIDFSGADQKQSAAEVRKERSDSDSIAVEIVTKEHLDGYSPAAFRSKAICVVEANEDEISEARRVAQNCVAQKESRRPPQTNDDEIAEARGAVQDYIVRIAPPSYDETESFRPKAICIVEASEDEISEAKRVAHNYIAQTESRRPPATSDDETAAAKRVVQDYISRLQSSANGELELFESEDEANIQEDVETEAFESDDEDLFDESSCRDYEESIPDVDDELGSRDASIPDESSCRDYEESIPDVDDELGSRDASIPAIVESSVEKSRKTPTRPPLNLSDARRKALKEAYDKAVADKNANAKAYQDQEKKLNSIKKRQELVEGGGLGEMLGLYYEMQRVQSSAVVAPDPESDSIKLMADAREDFSAALSFRLAGLEEKILEKEVEVQQLKLDVCAFEFGSSRSTKDVDAEETDAETDSDEESLEAPEVASMDASHQPDLKELCLDWIDNSSSYG